MCIRDRTSPRPRPLPRLPDRLDQPPDGLTRCCTSDRSRDENSSSWAVQAIARPLPTPLLRSRKRKDQRDAVPLTIVSRERSSASHGWSAEMRPGGAVRDLSLIHISEPTRLGMISYAVFCLKKKKK